MTRLDNVINIAFLALYVRFGYKSWVEGDYVSALVCMVTGILLLRVLMITNRVWVLNVVKEGALYHVKLGPFRKTVGLAELPSATPWQYRQLLILGPIKAPLFEVSHGGPFFVVTILGVDYFFNSEEVDLRGLTYDGWGVANPGHHYRFRVAAVFLVTGR